MKGIFILSLLVVALVLVLLPKKHFMPMMLTDSKLHKDMPAAAAEKVSVFQDSGAVSTAYKAVPTTEDLMDSYRTKPADEIRLERARILKVAESKNLYTKANQNAMTTAERDELAYVMRANTALSVLLIERELEQN